jgi:hypothetical protein
VETRYELPARCTCRRLVVLATAIVAACSDGDGASPIGVDHSPIERVCDEGDGDDPYADCIESFLPADDVTFGHDALPDVVLGPPQGGPAGAGSMDVASLGCGGRITLRFDAPGIVDGPGPDLLVFENAFRTGDETFAEPARVLVSDDGAAWEAFECDVAGDGTWPPTGCAGIEPVLAEGDPATDPTTAGGDAFDLADVGLGRASYVRLVDVTEEHYGDRMWCAGVAGGFDLDAMAAVEHAR